MSEKTGLDNITYDILSSLGKDAEFLYDTVDKYIRDAENANTPELVELWKTIRNERQKHVDMLKDALEKRFTTTKTTS
ncbi:MAG TPA: hypothetical protein VF242_12880 [Nitrososphaeraceae archaeon]|jgi:hypothetical protein